MPHPRPGVKPFYTCREVCQALGMSKDLLRKLRYKGLISYVQLRRGDTVHTSYYYRRLDILRLIEENTFLACQTRLLVQPADSPALLVSDDDALRESLDQIDGFTGADCIAEAAFQLAESPFWALVIDVPSIGEAGSQDLIAALGAREDIPYLVALHDQETPASTLARFDLALPLSLKPAKIVAKLAAERVTVNLKTNPNRDKSCLKKRRRTTSK